MANSFGLAKKSFSSKAWHTVRSLPMRQASLLPPLSRPPPTSPKKIQQLGANLRTRIYHVPAKWFLDLAAEHGLKLLIDIPWNKQLLLPG